MLLPQETRQVATEQQRNLVHQGGFPEIYGQQLQHTWRPRGVGWASRHPGTSHQSRGWTKHLGKSDTSLWEGVNVTYNNLCMNWNQLLLFYFQVSFRNNAKRPYSLHPNGVTYAKQTEGLSYEDGSTHWYRKDNEVQPNTTFTYLWKVEDKAGPTSEESDCRTWTYYSGVNPVSTRLLKNQFSMARNEEMLLKNTLKPLHFKFKSVTLAPSSGSIKKIRLKLFDKDSCCRSFKLKFKCLCW